MVLILGINKTTNAQCDIVATIIGQPSCDNNGTIADPSDDIYMVFIDVDDFGNPGGSWTSDDALVTNGTYGGNPQMYGPYYPIATDQQYCAYESL